MDVNEQIAALATAFADCRKAFTAMGDENRQLIILALLRHSGGMRVAGRRADGRGPSLTSGSLTICAS